MRGFGAPRGLGALPRFRALVKGSKSSVWGSGRMKSPCHEKRGPPEGEGAQRRGEGSERGGLWPEAQLGPGICEENGGPEGTKTKRREHGLCEEIQAELRGYSPWEGSALCKKLGAHEKMSADEGMGAE